MSRRRLSRLAALAVAVLALGVTLRAWLSARSHRPDHGDAAPLGPPQPLGDPPPVSEPALVVVDDLAEHDEGTHEESESRFEPPVTAPAAEPSSPRSVPRRARRTAATALAFVRWTVLGVALGLVGALAGAKLAGLETMTVMSGSMEPAIHTGDVVVGKPISPLDVRVGDVLTFQEPHGEGRLITHRVRRMRVGGHKVRFVTKGDANNTVEKWQIPDDGKVARVSNRAWKVGYALAFLRDPGRRLFLMATANSTNGIRGLLADGFQLGTDASVNAAGVTYHHASFRHTGSACTAPGATTVMAEADAWVNQASPTTNTGTASTMNVLSKSPNANGRALVRFALPTLPTGCSVKDARLRLYDRRPAGGRCSPPATRRRSPRTPSTGTTSPR